VSSDHLCCRPDVTEVNQIDCCDQGRNEAPLAKRPDVIVHNSKHEIGLRNRTCCEVIAEESLQVGRTKVSDAFTRLADCRLMPNGCVGSTKDDALIVECGVQFAGQHTHRQYKRSPSALVGQPAKIRERVNTCAREAVPRGGRRERPTFPGAGSSVPLQRLTVDDPRTSEPRRK
jgi:hypothetical protein